MNFTCIGLVLVIGLAYVAGKREEDINADDIKAAEQRQDFLARITLECSEETKLELDDAKKLLLGDLSIQTDEAKCFVRCIFKQEGFLNEDDEPQVEFIVDTLSASVKLKRKALTKIITKCSKSGDEDPCEFAFKLLQCYTNNQAIVKNIEL